MNFKAIPVLCTSLSIVVAVAGCPVFDAAAAEPDLVEMAPMSDGVDLSTVVYLPDPGVFAPPYPTVLLRTPYPDVLGALPPEVADMVINYMVDLFGLALVVQDTRGTGKSGGEPDAFFSDLSDGPETVDWVASQDWCDGRVLQFGLSALAIPGYLASPGASDNLRCQFLGEAAPDMYNLAAFHGGVFKKDTVENWLSWVGATSMLSDLSEHRNCDDYWDPLILDRIPGDIHAAGMHIGGWYDVFTEGIISGYRTYTDRGDEWAAGRQYMVIGPWDHWTLSQALGQNESYGYTMQADMLAWVTYCLAGDDSIVTKWPHVRYYVMGSTEPGAPGNEWRSAPDWPLPTEYRAFPISSQGVLEDPESSTRGSAAVMGGGHADDVTDGDSGPVAPDILPAAIPFDHSDVSPVVGGRNLVGSSGAMELSKVLSRDDYVMFQTEQLEEPFESIGRMSIRLDVSTRWPDADVIVRLADVYPDGSTWLISDGAARLSRRNGCEAVAQVEQDVTYSIDVDLWSSAMVFNTGHRIAVIVTSTLYSKYELNPALEAESRAHGRIDDAFLVHGGELLMPVASPFVDVPEVVETAEAVEDSGDVIVSDDAGGEVVADAAVDAVDDSGVTDAPEPAVDAVADVADGIVADGYREDARGDLTRVDSSEDGQPADLAGVDAASGDEGGKAGGNGGGCSAAGGPGPAAVPVILLFPMFAVFLMKRFRLSRR